MTKKIVAVVTSKTKLENGDPTGFWLEEFAAPYCVFSRAGVDVTIASPAGGKAQIDPASCEEPWLSEDGQSVLDDPDVMAKIADTVRLDDVDASQYDAVFIVGGVGAAFDLYNNPALTKLVEEFEKREKIISAICTGVVGLSDVKNARGELLLSGKTLTAISNAENDELQITPLLPVMTETRLKEAGAHYEAAAPWGACVREDDRLVTGQNPASAPPLAKAIVDRLHS